ncbi:MAG: hypothetical protein EKK41_09765 [Hyphomicrobiales bacterium]|nr:MAG: hypothetical protein EKK41_09765 [Hyphomicrobiales bacterium]
MSDESILEPSSAQPRSQSSGKPKLKVFLSYSRKDADFTRRLANALQHQGYTADFDQAAYDPDNVETGIAAEDEWWQRLQMT